MDTCTSGAQRRGDRAIGPYDYISCGETSEKVGAVSDRPGSEREQPSMNEVTVKFGGSKGGVDGHKISFSLGAWFSCVEQRDRQEGLFFNLGCTGREASCCWRKLSAGRRRARS